jgi:hypothetical protein
MRAPDRPGLTAVETVRFARILVLRSSDKSGEVVAAGAAATRFLRVNDMDGEA